MNSAIFTVVNAVVLRPLPFDQADRIVRLWHTPPQSTFPGMRIFALSPANFLDWEAQSSSFEAMAIYRGGQPTLTGQGEPTAVQSLRASASFLPIFGLQPIVGRGFTPADDRAGAAPTVLLSEGFWRSRFGADPGILGQPILLNLTPYTVVGVVPAPSFLEDVQVWTPLLWGPDDLAERANHNYRGGGQAEAGRAARHRASRPRHHLGPARAAVPRREQGLGRAGRAAARGPGGRRPAWRCWSCSGRSRWCCSSPAPISPT